LVQDYKLHKEILGSASDVIKAMFGGGFKEATMGPDEPIPLKGVEPLVFESVLR
jgi:BTB/POZ domain